MHVTDLHLLNFRNYRRLDLALPPGAVVLLGANAQGKSNLVDALHVLATGRSLRGGHEAGWVHVDAPASTAFARVRAAVARTDGTVDLEMVIARTDPAAGPASGVRRRVRIGGAPRRLADLPGRLQAVSFAAADLTLLTGPPTERRRWLDIALAQLDRCYLRALSAYEAVLSRRNALLRRIQSGQTRPDELAFWDERFAQPAVDLLERRQAYIRELAPRMAEEFERMAGGAALNLTYRDTLGCDDIAAVRAALLARRARDIEIGSSGVGPHRDDLLVTLDGRSLAHFGSRGQVRLAALAMKFAQFEVARRRSGESPVLLLDDIAAELDPEHRRRLLARLPSDAQILITSADPVAVTAEVLRHAPRLIVANGEVRPVDGSP